MPTPLETILQLQGLQRKGSLEQLIRALIVLSSQARAQPTAQGVTPAPSNILSNALGISPEGIPLAPSLEKVGRGVSPGDIGKATFDIGKTIAPSILEQAIRSQIANAVFSNFGPVLAGSFREAGPALASNLLSSQGLESLLRTPPTNLVNAKDLIGAIKGTTGDISKITAGIPQPSSFLGTIGKIAGPVGLGISGALNIKDLFSGNAASGGAGLGGMGLGALVGSLTPLGPIGGAAIGSTVGKLFGGLFGGGKKHMTAKKLAAAAVERKQREGIMLSSNIERINNNIARLREALDTGDLSKAIPSLSYLLTSGPGNIEPQLKDTLKTITPLIKPEHLTKGFGLDTPDDFTKTQMFESWRSLMPTDADYINKIRGDIAQPLLAGPEGATVNYNDPRIQQGVSSALDTRAQSYADTQFEDRARMQRAVSLFGQGSIGKALEEVLPEPGTVGIGGSTQLTNFGTDVATYYRGLREILRSKLASGVA